MLDIISYWHFIILKSVHFQLQYMKHTKTINSQIYLIFLHG